MLGHARASMTLDVYTDVFDEDVDGALFDVVSDQSLAFEALDSGRLDRRHRHRTARGLHRRVLDLCGFQEPR